MIRTPTLLRRIPTVYRYCTARRSAGFGSGNKKQPPLVTAGWTARGSGGWRLARACKPGR